MIRALGALGVAGLVVIVAAAAPLATTGDRAAAAGTGTWGHTDFDGDGDDELVIAVPSESVGTIQDAGAVTVLNGSPGGTTADSRRAGWVTRTTQCPGNGSDAR